MRIEHWFHKEDMNPKLDFSDVLLVPSVHDAADTEVKSRADVNLEVSYVFPNTEATYTGVPIVAANMDNIGTFKVREVFNRNNMCVALTKTTSLDSWKMNFNRHIGVNNNTAMVSIGIKDEDLDYLAVVTKHTAVKFICMDIANGYLPAFARQVSKVRKLYPDKIIVAGNVVTPDAAVQLFQAGADAVKVGIGPGSACFEENTLVKTESGHKKIKDIKIGDMVLTHKNRYQPVINTFINSNCRRIEINGVTCTPDHKFYVVDAKDAELVTDTNVQLYAKWITAENLDPDTHLIIEQN